MPQSALVFWNSIVVSPAPRPCHVGFRTSARLRPRVHLSGTTGTGGGGGRLPLPKPPVLSDSLRVLEWDKVCDAVASFAGTSLGREATKAKLWKLDSSYEQSKNLLSETAAAVEMLKYGAGGMDFSGIDAALVKSAIDRASRGFPVDGKEAMAVSSLIQFAETLQITVKTAMKEDSDWYNRFVPLAEMIVVLIINQPFVKLVRQVLDEDGSVKDSASSELKQFRDQVRVLEHKLYQLMDKLIRNDNSELYFMEVSIINGRWCIKSVSDHHSAFEGLLLSSGSGVESFVEPISAVPINDELQQARALVAKAEEDVLSRLTDKMVVELDDIRSLLHSIIQLDAVVARAKYSLAYGGAFPDLSSPGDEGGFLVPDDSSLERNSSKASLSHVSQKKWKLYLRKAYHPLLLQQHRENLKKARKDVTSAISDMRRARLQGKDTMLEDNLELRSANLKCRVAEMEENHPVPVDILVSMKMSVLVITGPNTGGKTIGLKTIGLASLMAKSGLYILASEPVQIPWFDAIFADIGDEQSLAQSLSTFSGHLKQINAIRSQSTCQSLVLLDEVGAGTNPLEGAALGMSLLESFAEMGVSLTIATTHHGELKTLKYSNKSFENACVEFDEINVKPTYKILWGVPGRSNAINIAERLGLPNVILDNARKLYGTGSAEINGIIVDMERFKQNFQKDFHEAQHYMKLSRKHHESLLAAKQKITEHGMIQSSKKVQAILGTAAVARSLLRKKLQQFRESTKIQNIEDETKDNMAHPIETLKQPSSGSISTGIMRSPASNLPTHGSTIRAEKKMNIPEVGEMVHVRSLGKKAMVLKVEASKEEIVVQASNMKLKLKLSDVESQKVRTL